MKRSAVPWMIRPYVYNNNPFVGAREARCHCDISIQISITTQAKELFACIVLLLRYKITGVIYFHTSLSS